jgi:hypothetical protein
MGSNRDMLDFRFQIAASVPQVIACLHPQPQVRTIAAELAKPQCHLRRNRRRLRHDAMHLLARYIKRFGSVGNRHPKRRQHILA